jgi:hypothetical protein
VKKPNKKKQLQALPLPESVQKKTIQARSLVPPDSGIHFTQLKHKAAVKGKSKKELKKILKHENHKHKGELEKMRSGDSGEHVLSKNKTAVLTEGIAAKPEISGSAMEQKIAKLWQEERKSGDKGPLESFLSELIHHISPEHATTDDVPAKANYIGQVKTKHTKALAVYQKIEHLHAGEAMREKFAFKIAIYVSRSPVNLLPGDMAPKLDPPKTKTTTGHSAHSKVAARKTKINTTSKANNKIGGKLRTSSRGK